MRTLSFLIIVTLATLSACSDDKKSDQTAQPTAAAGQSVKTSDNILKDQKQVLDNAKGVEGTVLQQADQERKDIDEKQGQ